MPVIAQYLPALPGFTGPKTFAAWPVWSNSTTAQIRFQPLPKKAATKLWHRARDFDRSTREKGRHGGAIGHSALQVLHSLIFDFLHYASGRLDPSYAAIACKSNLCERTVASALKRLKELGVINWVRRCTLTFQPTGGAVKEQDTNAYAVLPASQWRGYHEPPEPPLPAPGTWGDHPPLPDVMAQAVADRKAGASFQDMLKVLESDPTDKLATTLASFGRTMEARKSP